MADFYPGFEERSKLMESYMTNAVMTEYDYIQRDMIVKLARGAQCSKCLTTAKSWEDVLQMFTVTEVYPGSNVMDRFQKKCYHRKKIANDPNLLNTGELISPIEMVIDLTCHNCQHEGSINRDMDHTYVVGN